MPYDIQWNSHGTVVRFSGEITLRDINRANDEHYAHPSFDEFRYQLFDFSDADLSGIALEDAREPAAIDSAASSYKRHLKVALVGSGNHAQQLFNEYTLTLKRFGSEWVVETFTTLADALAWCHNPSPGFSL